MAERVIRIKLLVEAPGAAAAGNQAATALERTAKAADQTAVATEKSGRSFGSLAKSGLQLVGLTTGIAAVASGFKAVVSSGVDFESNLNTIAAVSGATADQMSRVSATARQLGSDVSIPAASATDAASAMTELAKGGLDVEQSMKAAHGTLLLAAAAQVSGAEAATIQSSALNAFALSAGDANRVADVLANTANQSAAEITDIAAGLQQSAAVAHAFGISLEDSATTLGLFANAGIKGSDAGTSFKTMLTSLSSPTKQQQAALDALNLTVYDAQGQFVGMRSVTEQLAAAKQRMTTQEYNAAAGIAFGSDAIRAANILAEGGVAAFDKMSDAVGKTGGAAEVANAKMQGLPGKIELASSAASDFALNLYDKLQPALTGAADFVIGLISAGSGLVDFLGSIPGPVYAVAAALAAVAVLKGPLSGAMSSIVTAVRGFGDEMRLQTQLASMGGQEITRTGAAFATASTRIKAAGKSFAGAFGGPIGLTITGITLAVSALSNGIGSLEVQTHDFSGALDELTGKIDAAKVGDVVDEATIKNMQAAGVAAGDYTKALAGNPEAIGRVSAALKEHVEASKGDAAAFIDGTRLLEQFGKDLGGTYSAQQDFIAAERERQAVIAETTGITRFGRSAADEYGQAVDGAGQAATDAGTASGAALPSVEDLTGAWADGVIDAGEFAGQIQTVMDALDKLAGRNGDAEAAQRTYNAEIRNYVEAQLGVPAAQRAVEQSAADVAKAQADYNQAVKDYGPDSAEAQQAGRDLAGVQDDLTTKTLGVGQAQDDANQSAADLREGMVTLAQKAYDTAVAQGNLSGAHDAAVAAAQGAKDAFYNAQSAADKESGAAQILTDKLFGIPEDVVSTIEANTDQAAAAVTSLQALIDAIPDSQTKRITIDAVQNITTNNTLKTFDSATGLLVPYNGYTGGYVSELMGFAQGGLIPGRPPSNPRVDNVLAAVNGKPLKVRSGEFIMSEPAVQRIGVDTLSAMNSGYAAGGYIPPGGAQTGWGAGTSLAVNPNVQVYIGDREFTDMVRVVVDGVPLSGDKWKQGANAAARVDG